MHGCVVLATTPIRMYIKLFTFTFKMIFWFCSNAFSHNKCLCILNEILIKFGFLEKKQEAFICLFSASDFHTIVYSFVCIKWKKNIPKLKHKHLYVTNIIVCNNIFTSMQTNKQSINVYLHFNKHIPNIL